MSFRRPRESWWSNRAKSMQPRGTGFYCDGCDRNLIAHKRKCKLCGSRQGKRRLKKGSQG